MPYFSIGLKQDPNWDGGSEIFNDYKNNKANKGGSHVEGYNNTAKDKYSHLEGMSNTALYPLTHAEGTNNTNHIFYGF